MSEVKKIANNTIWQIVGKAISTVLGLVAIYIMTRALGVEKFGWYATAIGFLQFFGILTDFGFVVVTSNMLAEPKYNKSKLLNNLFTWRLLTAIISQGIIAFTIFLFPYPIEVKWAVIIMAMSFVGVSLNQIFAAFYRNKLQTHIQAIGEVIGRIFLVVGLFLVLSYGLGFLSVMAVITVASLVYTGYLWLKCDPIKLELNADISRAIFIKMWPTALAVIFNAIYLQGDRFLLPLFVSQSNVGLYTAAYRVLDIVMQISAMLIGLIMPLITFAYSRKLYKEFVKQAQRSFDIMSLFLIPMIVGVFVLAEPIMLFVAGEDFIGSGWLLQHLIFAVVGISFGMVFGHIILSVGKQKQALWIYFSDAVLSLIGYLIFIPRFGVTGAVYVTIFSEVYAGIGLMVMSGYFSKFWPRFSAFNKILLASAIMGLIIYFIQPINVIFSILIGGIIYGSLVLLFGVISKQTIREIIK